MSDIDTRDKLISRVRQWLGGNSTAGFSTAINVSIELAEADMNKGFMLPNGDACKGLRVPEMVKRVSFSVDEKYEVLPPDFLEALAIYRLKTDGTEVPLGRILEDRAGALDACRGDARYYCVTGMQLRIAPRPETGSVSLRMLYYAKAPPLDDDTSCTAILRNYPGIYLYGTLAHMEGWVMDDPRIPQWKTMFHSLIKGANKTAMSRGGSLAA